MLDIVEYAWTWESEAVTQSYFVSTLVVEPWHTCTGKGRKSFSQKIGRAGQANTKVLDATLPNFDLSREPSRLSTRDQIGRKEEILSKSGHPIRYVWSDARTPSAQNTGTFDHALGTFEVPLRSCSQVDYGVPANDLLPLPSATLRVSIEH